MTQKDAVKGYQTITLKKAGNTQCGIFSHVCPHTAIISVILLTVYIVYAKYEEKKLSGTLKCNQPRKLNDLQKRALKCLKQTPKIKVPKANHRFSCPPSRYTFLKKKKKDSGCTDFRCCVRAFSSCGKQGLLFTLVHRRLIAVASPVAEHRLQAAQASTVAELGLRSCGTWVQLFRGMWNLLDQESNPCLLHWQVYSYPLYHQGSP